MFRVKNDLSKLDMAEVDLSILFLKAIKSFSKSPLRLTDHLIIGLFIKWTYTKYVGGGDRRVLQIFQKKFRSPGGHRPKYFMVQ